MTVETRKETLGFQTEVKQLLQLMIHSLYSNKEIFLRELVSNAADAADKLRFEALKQPALLEEDPTLRVRVEFDPQARTVTIDDNGIGMSRDEAIAHLGTIAKSGTGEFLKALSGDQKKDASLIGPTAWTCSAAAPACPPPRACTGPAPAKATSRSPPSTSPSAAPASCCT